MPRVENGYGFPPVTSVTQPNGEPVMPVPSSSFDFSSPSWQNITETFTAAAKTLRLGEVVHDASFSLFEGMSAIELMDPKMDAGMAQGPSRCKPVSFDIAVSNGTLKLANIPLGEQIAIMDATLACLFTWLEGHSLAQTLFINLYTHKPYEIDERTLKAYVIGILKLTWLCGEVIRRACICEEEDFQPTSYGFSLCNELSETRALGMLKEADEDCQKAIRNIKGSSASEESQTEIMLYDAVSSRLRIVRNLLVAVLALTGKGDQRSLSLVKHNSPRSHDFEEAQRALENCKTVAEKAFATLNLGPVPDDDDDGTYNLLSCIVPNLNQRLLPPTFPRRAKLFSPTATIEYLRRLVQQLMNCSKLPEFVGSFDSTLEFYRDFSRKENCLLSRSVLQAALSFTGGGTILGKVDLIETVKEAMKDFIQPPVLQPKFPVSGDPQCQQVWDEFLCNCRRVLPELLRVCGYNRARQRDRLATVLEDLASLQEEADRVDCVLHSALNRPTQPLTSAVRNHLACLGSFVLYHILMVMLDYLFLGFELELYAVHEYACMYWYAYEFLYKWLVNVMHKADNMIYDQDQANNKVKDKKKKNSKKKPLKMHRWEILHLQSKQKLCEGYYKSLMGFYSLNRIRVPSFAGGDCYNAIRYEHRLAPFAHLATPPMITYSQFLEISGFQDRLANIPSSRSFTEAAQCFDEARLGLENTPSSDENETAVLIRICKMNVVVLRLLASGHKSDAKEWPIFDFQLHRHFPVLRLK